MTIKAYRITNKRNILLAVRASSLDELTRNLPQGFYTTFSTLAMGTRVFGLQQHLRRLYLPARKLGIVPSVDETTLRIRLATLARMELPGETRVRVILTRTRGTLYAGVQPFEALPAKVYQQGVVVITSEFTRHDPRIKDTSFISESESQRAAIISGEVFEILLTKEGQIFEGMTSNFYAVKGKTLVTAQRGILPGVTRRRVLRLARRLGLQIAYRPPRLDDIFDESFLTSSSRGVVPIVSINGLRVGEGRVGKWTRLLSDAYQTMLQKRSEKIVE